MGWLEPLHGSLVAIDTAPIIYHFEDHPRFGPPLLDFFAAVDQGAFRLTTSVITLIEVLVQPLRRGDDRLAERYRTLLAQNALVRVLPVSEGIAERAAALRAAGSLRLPDANQLASAIEAGAQFLITNDKSLPHVEGVACVTVSDIVEKAS